MQFLDGGKGMGWDLLKVRPRQLDQAVCNECHGRFWIPVPSTGPLWIPMDMGMVGWNIAGTVIDGGNRASR